MLIKEYHIPLPLTLEEYRIAQLYMIQKKSREESEGEGSAVEILENHPYTDGPNGSGQYTYKVYHIGRHLPNWFRGIAPKTALEVHEEAWNAYPYTKTIFKVPFVEKFSLEVETYFFQDGGTQENLFKLSPSELRSRELDVIDIVNNELSGSDYKKEEDPSLYSSDKTGRGPLKSDWIAHPPQGVVMCAYKLIKVEFRYWGLQSKVERFIHDYGIRRVMLRAHRQAWAWQDEWIGLTIADIRRLERETQFILQKKLGRLPPDAVYKDEEEEEQAGGASGPVADENDSTSVGMADDELSVDSSEPTKSPDHLPAAVRRSLEGERSKGIGRRARTFSLRTRRTSAKHTHARRQSESSLRSCKISISTNSSDPFLKSMSLEVRQSLANRSVESDEESMYSTRPEWAFDQIAMLSDESDSEFFDARETISEDEDISDEEEERESAVESSSPDRPSPIKGLDPKTNLSASIGALPGSEGVRVQRSPQLGILGKARSLDHSIEDIGTPCVHGPDAGKPSSPADILFLVFQGGSALDACKDRIGKDIDFQTLSSNFKSVTELHFPSAVGRVAIRMVPCVNVCSQALQLLTQVKPTPATQARDHPLPTHSRQDRDFTHSFMETLRGYPTHVPVGAVPLLATDHHGYTDNLTAVAATANKVYHKYLQSKEGENFTGQVCLLADCMGSVIAYDILASTHTSRHDTPSPEHTPYNLLLSPSPPIRKRTSSQSSPSSTPPINLGDGKRHSRISISSLSSSTTSINVTDGEMTGFDFEITHFFAFGSPLGLVLGSRKSKFKKEAQKAPSGPNCTAFYNLFYDVDPMASRVEPLLDTRFSEVSPISVPSYRLYPAGAAKANSLMETVVQHPHLFGSQTLSLPQSQGSGLDKNKSLSSECLAAHRNSVTTGRDIKPFSVWWSQSDANRIDYLLESPVGSEGFNLLPQAAFSHIIHSRYWEAKELVSFMLRQVLHHDTVSLTQTTNGKELIPFLPQDRVSPWKKRTTSMKIKRLSPNHRVSDVLAVESGPPPSFTAKFQYGPLAMTSLCKEEVEVYLLLQTPKPRWELFGGGVTDKHGKLVFSLPTDRPLPAGAYPVKFIVKGDHTTASCNLFIVPLHTEAAVFSVDGALASNFSLSAKDMRVKQGAVETVSHWQKKGYLLIYITGRPLIQKENILSFLGAHRFPLGLVACADSLSPADSQTFKTMYLGRLIKEAKLIIHVAYGSQRHLAGFKELGLQSDQIYIHASRRASRNYSSACCQYLLDGFATHLSSLNPRQASYDARKLLGDICFVLPGIPKSEGSKKSKRSSSKTDGSSEKKSRLSLDNSHTPLQTTV